MGPLVGVFSFEAGTVTLDFPPGALTSDQTITVRGASGGPRVPRSITDAAFDFGPNGLVFERPVRLRIPSFFSERMSSVMLGSSSSDSASRPAGAT